MTINDAPLRLDLRPECDLVARLRDNQAVWLNAYDNCGSPEVEVDWGAMHALLTVGGLASPCATCRELDVVAQAPVTLDRA